MSVTRHTDPVGLSAQSLAGTEDATYPFWSPDSRSIGFFADRKLKKIEAAGGPALTLCDAPNGRGGAWNRDGVIVFAPNTGGALQRVSASGGQASAVTKLDEAELIRRIPDFDALVVRSETRVTARIIEAGRKLRVVGRAGVGVDNIDLKAQHKPASSFRIRRWVISPPPPNMRLRCCFRPCATFPAPTRR